MIGSGYPCPNLSQIDHLINHSLHHSINRSITHSTTYSLRVGIIWCVGMFRRIQSHQHRSVICDCPASHSTPRRGPERRKTDCVRRHRHCRQSGICCVHYDESRICGTCGIAGQFGGFVPTGKQHSTRSAITAYPPPSPSPLP